MSVFDHKDFDGHEDVVFCHDESVGLRAIIAIHSTAQDPAAGGCRMMPYASVDEALTDVLRLSKGMTYKSALAGLPLGGGKSVIIADPASPQKADVLRAFGRHVQALGGRYWTAIDVGVGPADVDVVAQTCDYVFARASQYPPGFNPAHYTALGGLTGIQAVVEHLRRHGRLRARDDASDLHGSESQSKASEPRASTLHGSCMRPGPRWSSQISATSRSPLPCGSSVRSQCPRRRFTLRRSTSSRPVPSGRSSTT